MDKLDTSLVGGFPFDLNDVEWLQNAIRGPFKGVADAFGPGYVLSGCEVTDLGAGTYAITAGWVVLLGELFEYEGTAGTSLPGGIALYSFAADQTLDPSGVEVFEDISSQNAYIKRRAVLGITGVVPDMTPVVGMRLVDRITEMLAYEVPGPWHILDDPGEPALGGGYFQGSGAQRVMFRKEPGGIIRIKGILNAASVGVSNGVAFTLPAGFRPTTGLPLTGVLVKPALLSPVNAHRYAYLTSSGDFVVYLPVSDPADLVDIYNLANFPTFFAEN
ncbi:MAG: hypothetical protein ABI432_08985 [Flavobacteriales bacterium]